MSGDGPGEGSWGRTWLTGHPRSHGWQKSLVFRQGKARPTSRAQCFHRKSHVGTKGKEKRNWAWARDREARQVHPSAKQNAQLKERK